MRKKIILVVVLVLLVSIGSAFAWGVGVEGGLPFVGNLPGSNVMLSLKLDNWPLLGIGVGGFGNTLSLGLLADFWLINENIAGAINVYLGPGAYLGLSTGSPAEFTIGARLPIGLNIFPLKFLELFIEVAPGLGIMISNQVNFGWNIMGAFGVRFWFN